MNTLASEKGFSTLVSAYSSSSFTLKNFKINAGLNTQLFTLNNKFTIEPRLGLSYQLNENNALNFGYGLHSRTEALNVYFANTINATSSQANKDLDFSKAYHLILAYDWNITEKLHLKIEPYYQYLFNIPVVENTTTSLLSLQNDWFITDAYVNKGKGLNYGLDLTLEQYINNGFYYLISASVFNSKYKTDTDDWYSTRFNKNYMFNTLIGKEFRIGKKNQNLLSLNLRLNLQGGDRYSIIDGANSLLEQDVVYNKTTPFTEKTDATFFTHFTINYEWYKKKTTQKLSLKMINAFNQKEFRGHRYNINTNQVEEFNEGLIVPNISYKISF